MSKVEQCYEEYQEWVKKRPMQKGNLGGNAFVDVNFSSHKPWINIEHPNGAVSLTVRQAESLRTFLQEIL